MKNKNRKRIAMLAYTEYSRDPRVRRYAEFLVDEGYNVDCIVLKEKETNQKFFKDQIKMIYMPMYQYRGNSNISYVYSYVRFFINSFYFLSIKSINKYSLIHVHNMPDFLVFSTILNKIFGTKIILDIHDNMPEIYKDKFEPLIAFFICKILLFQERLSAIYSDVVITVHEPHLNYNIKYHKLNPNKSKVVHNFADFNLFRKKKNIIHYKINDEFKLIYHGTIAKRFDLTNILKGISIVRNKYNVKLNIYGKGDGLDELKKQIKQLNLENLVSYKGMIPLDNIPDKISQSHLGIVSYAESTATSMMLPLKLMEYVAMELPVLTVKNVPIQYYFGNTKLAFYKSGSPESFSKELVKIIENPKKREYMQLEMKKFNQKFNWNHEKYKYLKILNDINL